MKKIISMSIMTIVMALIMTGCAVNTSGIDQIQDSNLTNDSNIKASLNSSESVKLIYAKTRLVNLGSALLIPSLSGDIELENIAYTKEVVVAYTLDGENWLEQAAYYKRQGGNNKEIWSFTIDAPSIPFSTDNTAVNFKFAVKYDVNGQTYWDNNGDGTDYKVSTAGINAAYDNQIIMNTNVYFINGSVSKTPYPYNTFINTFSGSIAAELCDCALFGVEIVYSSNNWQTSNVVKASYSTDENMWKFNTSFYGNVSNIKFAVSYNNGEQTYWDNNYGQDYTLNF